MTASAAHLHATRTTDGTAIPWADHGARDGTPVVFIHGLSDSHRSWDDVVAHLPASVRAVCVTLRGHGDADRPVTGYHVAELAEDVAAVLDDADIDRAIVVGHSLGTQVALHLAAGHPGRVSRLVLLGAFVPTASAAVVAELDEAMAGLSDPIDPEFVRGFQDSTTSRPVEPKLLGLVVDESLKVPTRVWRAAWEGLRDADQSVPDVIATPTTLVWGSHDEIATRPMQDELLARLVDAELVVVDGAGHAPHWEDPVEFIEHLVPLLDEDDHDPAVGEALMERLFQDTIGALELFGVHLGVQLGLYVALRDRGAMTADQLAAGTDIDARYAREWLEQQAVAGLLVAEPTHDDHARRFSLPPAHVDVLTRPDAATHVAPFAAMVAGIGGVMDEVVAAYRSGDGVAYDHYGPVFRAGQGGINRPAFGSDLVSSWLPAAGLHGVLDRPGVRIADLGCGHGWSTIAVAHAHPGATVVGLDADEASILEAGEHARVRGVEVEFRVGRAEHVDEVGSFDLILMLEMLHDLADPVAALDASRRALTDGGVVLVADEAVAEDFSAPGDDIERIMYGFSITHCLPASRDESPSAAIGTVIRPRTVADLATRAGFARVERVDVDAGFFHLYRLVP